MATITAIIASVLMLGSVSSSDAVKAQPPPTQTLFLPTNIKSLSFDRIEAVGSERNDVVVNEEYYDEITRSSIEITRSRETNIGSNALEGTAKKEKKGQDPVNQQMYNHTSPRSNPQYSLTIDYSNYHPSDQVWACYHLSNHLTNTKPNASSMQSTSSQSTKSPQSTPTTLTIKPTALPAFLSCCPTVYMPTYDEKHLQGLEMTLNYPFKDQNSNLNQVGCGHSTVLLQKSPKTVQIGPNITVISPDDEFATTGEQSDRYPRMVGKDGYRNTPNPWYYDPSIHNQSDGGAITHVQFGVATSWGDSSNGIRWVNPRLDGQGEVEKRNEDDENEEKSKKGEGQGQNGGKNEYQLTPLSCQSRSFSHDGEGYHRSLSFEFDPETCNLINGINNDVNHQNNNTNKDKNINNSLFATTRNLSQCNYLVHLTLPNSIFVDPYQISYTLLAQHHTELRARQALEEPRVTRLNKIHSNHPGTQTTSEDQLESNNSREVSKDDRNNAVDAVPVTSTRLVKWFLYDFIDVEAQLNSAFGNNLVLTFPLDGNNDNNINNNDNINIGKNNNHDNTSTHLSLSNSTQHLKIPIHLRYGSSQMDFSDRSDTLETKTSFIDSIHNVLESFLSTKIHKTGPNQDKISSNNEFRYKTLINEPLVYLYCPNEANNPLIVAGDADEAKKAHQPPSNTDDNHAKPLQSRSNNNGTAKKSLLPSISTLFTTKQQLIHSKLHRFISPLMVTVPVGSLNLYPVVLPATFTVMVITAVVINIVIIGKWIGFGSE